MRQITTKYAAPAIACAILAFHPALAEDTNGKWQFGFGLSYYSTTDYIRSNSDIAVSEVTAGTGDGLPGVGYVDDRPDQNMLNEPSARDNFKWDFSASYGLTRWLALEMSAGYMTTAVGNIEYYLVDREKFIGNGTPSTGANNKACGPQGTDQCFRYPGTTGASATLRSNEFVSVGELTEIPVQLSALVRFRPESPLDPYIGLGVGYIFNDFQASDEFAERGRAVSALNVTSGFGGEVDTGQTNRQAPQPGFHPAPLQAEVSDGFEYHAVGGVDYFFNEHMSMYVDARYVWSQTSIDITTDGAHQVRMAAYYPGRLVEFQEGSVASPKYWEDRGFGAVNDCRYTGSSYDPNGLPCAGDHLLASEDSNGNGTLDPAIGEGYGKLYLYPQGPNPNNPEGEWTATDPGVRVIDCTGQGQANCPWAQLNAAGQPIGVVPDTEDLNNNRYADRFYLWAIDACSVSDLAGANPLCNSTNITPLPQHVWPGGCGLSLADPTTPRAEAEGCPRPPNLTDVTQAPADDTSDTHIIQGGDIKLGGFSLGVGFKFTF